MRVNFSGLDILVAELLLYRTNIRNRLQQVRGEGMPQGVTGHLLLNTGDPGRLLYKLVDCRFVQVMTSQAAVGLIQ